MIKAFHLPTIPLRRKSKDEAEAHNSDSACTTVVEQQSEDSSSGGPAQEKCTKNMRNIFKLKRKKRQKAECFDTPDIPVLDFNQNLAQHYLAEASQQLLAREEHLFNPPSSDEEAFCTEDEEDTLQKDYEALMLHLRMAIQDSFQKENQERLRSAIQAICQQEEQDKHWDKAAKETHPPWRPLQCREIHDSVLKQVVAIRVQQANEEENEVDKLSTSLKTEVCRIGKRIKKDLLQVVRDVQQSYTAEFDICNMYAQLYHQAFSKKLTEFAQTNIELPDCVYILCWIHDYYPKDILQHEDLIQHINTESLGALLPEEVHKSQEEQYLSHKEVEVRTWLSKALKEEEETWQMCNKPELIDECYISNLALDIIPIINRDLKETMDILGNSDNAQRIMLQLNNFLESYKKSIADLIQGKHINIPNTLKANLVSIRQLREYIEKHENLSDELKGAMLSTISEMRNSCHSYFLSRIHKELKEQYRKLWTLAWFSESHMIIGELLKILEDKLQHFSDLQPACTKELWGQLHFEVMIEYVKRMLKRKLKLKDKDSQEAAAGFLCEDSVRINSLFITSGSEEKWLSRILPTVSEVVRLQDPGALQLELVVLARTYPDISECQVLALLDLKANLGKADVSSIKKSLTENRDSLSTEPTPAFFSKVPVKRKIMTVF